MDEITAFLSDPNIAFALFVNKMVIDQSKAA